MSRSDREGSAEISLFHRPTGDGRGEGLTRGESTTLITYYLSNGEMSRSDREGLTAISASEFKQFFSSPSLVFKLGENFVIEIQLPAQGFRKEQLENAQYQVQNILGEGATRRETNHNNTQAVTASVSEAVQLCGVNNKNDDKSFSGLLRRIAPRNDGGKNILFHLRRGSGFADGRRNAVASPDSEQIEHTVAKPQMRNYSSVEQIQDRLGGVQPIGKNSVSEANKTIFHFPFSIFHLREEVKHVINKH